LLEPPTLESVAVILLSGAGSNSGCLCWVIDTTMLDQYSETKSQVIEQITLHRSADWKSEEIADAVLF